MKRTTKFVIGTAAMVAVSAGVAGVTAYTLIQKNQQQNANSFYDVFKGAPMRTVALDATSMQPVDLTQAAESSLNSVVHIMAIQRSKVKPCRHSRTFLISFSETDVAVNVRCKCRNSVDLVLV